MDEAPYFHVAFLVRSLDEAMPRFSSVLGVSFLTPRNFELEHFVDVAHFGDDTPRPWSGRAVYSRQGPPFYELVEAKGQGIFSLDGREEGFHHVGMFVDNSHETALMMADQGVSPGAKILGADGRARVTFTAPADFHGLRLELLDSTSNALKEILEEIAKGDR